MSTSSHVIANSAFWCCICPDGREFTVQGDAASALACCRQISQDERAVIIPGRCGGGESAAALILPTLNVRHGTAADEPQAYADAFIRDHFGFDQADAFTLKPAAGYSDFTEARQLRNLTYGVTADASILPPEVLNGVTWSGRLWVSCDAWREYVFCAAYSSDDSWGQWQPFVTCRFVLRKRNGTWRLHRSVPEAGQDPSLARGMNAAEIATFRAKPMRDDQQ